MFLIRRFRSLTPATQLLLLNVFTVTFGFYMLYPYLAVYLAQVLGFPAWQVGFLLGLRLFCQQGLQLIGGPLADHFGYKPLLIAGLASRTIAFGLFAFQTEIGGIALASVLTGVAGALFVPAMRAYMAFETDPEERTEIYAMETMFGQAGIMIGPLIGVVLIGINFQLVSLVAAIIFLVLSLAQLPFLPWRDATGGSGKQMLADWREIVLNRPFLLFSVGQLFFQALYNQLFLGLALETNRVTGGDSLVGFVFLTASAGALIFQYPVALFYRRHFGQMRALAIGMGLMGLAFVPVLVSAYTLPLPGENPVAGLINFSPVILSAAILSLGVMSVQVFSNELIPRLAHERLIASYTGFFSLWSGIGTIIGTSLAGAAFDARTALHVPGLPWMFLISIGVLSGLFLYVLTRRGTLSDPVRAA